MRLELVRDWMSRDVISVSPETTLSAARQLMITHGIRRLPVVANSAVVGLLSKGDLGVQAEETDSRPVAAVMSQAPVTVGPDETIGAAAELMLQHQISCLPVIDTHGALVGIITESDIFKLVVRHWMAEKGGPAPYRRYD